MSAIAAVLGFAYESPVAEFPVRTGPGTNYSMATFRARKGLSGLEVLDIQPDSQSTRSNFGRIYQWFELRFPDGKTGWMRGHVIGIQGDFSAYGYGIIGQTTHAYTLIRDMSKVSTPAKDDAPAKPEPAKDATPSKPEPAKPTPAIKQTSEMNPLAAAARRSGRDESAEDEPAAMMKKSAQIGRPSGPPEAIIKTSNAANTRQGPSTIGFERVFQIPRDTRVPILEVRRENRGRNFRWFRVSYQGREGWLREDLCSWDGDTEPVELPWDLYPSPMGDNRWWIRDYNMPPNKDESTWDHNGWDLGAPTGEAVNCGPFGGRVVQVMDCDKCTSGRPNTPAHGIRLGDPSVFTDPGWGFGYGTFVVVGYDFDQLPPSTKKKLAEAGYDGGSLFVNYAHLEKRAVENGQTLVENATIGTCGNTGNSEATHLHLEVRASKSSNYTSWGALRSGLMNPEILFKR